jgi:TRAP-type C4-dicarboxylate transport system permease small subunit
VSVLERLSISCNRSIEGALLLLGLTMTAIVILQVFYRYALNHSLFWSEELARYLLVWLTFLGATVAYRRHMHPSVDVLFKRLGRPARKRLRVLVRLQTTPALTLPKWLIFAIIPLSGLIFTLHALAFLSGELNPQQQDRVKP